jgi:integrase
MAKASFQNGSVIRVSRKGVDCWRLRYRLNGTQHSDFIGSIRQYPTKSSAEKAAEKMRSLLNNAPTEIITMSDLIDRYEREAMPERAATAASYKSIFRRIRDRWGAMRLDQFSIDMVSVEVWLQELTVIGRHPKPGPKSLVSPLFRAQIKNLMHTLIEHAMKWGALPAQRNCIELVRLKGGARVKDIVILDVAQYAALLDDPELPEVVKVLIQLLSGLGLRISEALGLQWSDTDFEAGTIQIQRSVVHGQANDTKTASSKTVLPLHSNLVEVLRAWKEREAFKSRWVFCSERTGRPLDRDWLRAEYLQPAGERIGVGGLGWHGLRHLHRALLRQCGTPIEAQKNLMRHSKISTTFDVYGGSGKVEELRPVNARVIEMLARKRA